MTELPGGCLCGAVRFVARPHAMTMQVCHCAMCRRWTGGVFMAVHCARPVRFSGEAAIGRYASSPGVARGFCRQCGSTLFWEYDGTPRDIELAARAFDDSAGVVLVDQFCIDMKPPNYTFANETTTHPCASPERQREKDMPR